MFHTPVLAKEAIEFLQVKKGGIYVDATLGDGGHAEKILSLLGKKGKLIGLDQDEEALERAKSRLSNFKEQVIFVHHSFKDLDLILKKLKIKKIDGILFDLGVSTPQLETPERGFSFKEDFVAPLDMRMDRRQKLTAQEIINRYPETQLRDLFFGLGEEPYSASIAREILRRRKKKPIKTTAELLQVIKTSTPPAYRYSRRKHYATKIFRALRMEVNQELKALEEVLPQAVSGLKKGGRIVVISFHSLEDRIVKQKFKEFSRESLVKILSKKPIMAREEEIEKNIKSRSAKMRVAEKIA